MTPQVPQQPQDQSAQMFMLGQIHSMVDALKKGQDLQALALKDGLTSLHGRVDKIDERLRSVEQRSAAVGAVSGGAMAIGVALIVEGLKQWVKRGTPTP